ncbi:hypothetical protein vseg_001051 [Gypsophila vaccaria]
MELPSNACCALLKSKYDKVCKGRQHLRDATQILEHRIHTLQSHNTSLLQACEEQRNRADVLEEAKEEEASRRASLEEELAALKSQMCSTVKPDVDCKKEELEKEMVLLRECISEKDKEIERLNKQEHCKKEELEKETVLLRECISEKDKEIERLKKQEHCQKEEMEKETAVLRECISEKDEEIERLKKQLAEEKLGSGAGKKVSPSEKKKVAELQKSIKLEKSRADKSIKIAEAAKKKTEEDRLLIDRLNNDIKIISLKLEETDKMFEAEKQRVSDERNNADEEKARVIELRRIVEVNEKKLADEKSHAYNLSMMLEGEKQKADQLQKELQEVLSCPNSDLSSQLDELRRNLEAEKEKIVAEKKRADLEKSEKEEQKKTAEVSMKKSIEERHRADMLLQDVQSSALKIESLQQELSKVKFLLDAERLVSDKEKQRADALNLKLEEQQRIALEMNKSRLEKLSEQLEAEKKKVEFERQRADIEMSAKEEQKKISEANIKKAMEEKLHSDNLSQDLQNVTERNESLEVELNKVKCMLEAERLLASERNNAEAMNLKLKEQQRIALEVEKSHKLSLKLEEEEKKVAAEKKRADLEMSAKEEQKKVSEANMKIAMEEKLRADKLLQDFRPKIESLEVELSKVNCLLEAERLLLAEERNRAESLKSKLEEQSRISIENEKRAMVEESRSERMIQELDNIRNKLKDTENQLYEVKQFRSLAGVSVAPTAEQIAKVSLLQEQLKFEKKRVKHYKEVAMLEKDRKSGLQQEMHNVRHDFQCLLQQMDVLSDTFGARNHLNKKRRLNVQNLEFHGRMPSRSPPQLNFCDADLRLSSLSSRDTSCHVMPNIGITDAGQPMESPSASFSDEQLLGSQERAVGSPTRMEAEDPDRRATMARWIDSKRAGTVAEKCTDTVELVVGHDEKRRKIDDESESIRFSLSQGKTVNQTAATNLSDLRKLLVNPMSEQLEKVDLPVTRTDANLCGNFDPSGKKRKLPDEPQVVLQQVVDSAVQMEKLASLTTATTNNRGNSQPEQAVRSDLVVSIQDDLISFEQGLNGDYMKLLDLDDMAAEKRFRMALESPLTPTLPDIDLQEFDKEVESQILGMPVRARSNAIDTSGEHDEIPDFCVVFSDMRDDGCITRILCATRTCISHLHSPLQTPWLVEDILLSLVSELDLVPREKVCVLFSLILLNFAAASCVKSTASMDFQSKELADTFCTHLQSVLLNMDTKHLFAKVCSLSDLLGLSEDFLLHKKILLKSYPTDSLTFDDSKIEILHLGENYVLHHNLASADMVLAGSMVMASISLAAGLVDYLCEISLKIIRMGRADNSLTLLILHTFALVCGDEYFTNSDYHSAMKVVKFMVVSTECSLARNDDIHLGDCTWHQFFPFGRCPFAGSSLCMDDVFSKLLEEVQVCAQPCHQVDMYGSRFLVAVMSALELLAYDMSWDWVCNKAVAKLFETLESCDPGSVLSTIVVTLLGDIGKRGVEAFGYSDPVLKSITQRLSANLLRTSAMKCSTLPMAIVHALIQLHPNGNDLVLKNDEDRSVKGMHPASCTPASDILTTMVSSLSSEHTSAMRPLLNCVFSNISA